MSLYVFIKNPISCSCRKDRGQQQLLYIHLLLKKVIVALNNNTATIINV